MKFALVAFAATVTEAGTVTEALLLARLTANPPFGAAAVSVTVQAFVPAPVIDPLEQEIALRDGVGCTATRLIESLSDFSPRLALTVTCLPTLTVPVVAENTADFDPEAT